MFAATVADVQPVAADAVQPGWLAVTVNGTAQGDTLVLRQGDEIHVSVEALERWGVTIEGLPAVALNGQRHVPLRRSGLAFTLDEATQSLVLMIAPARLRATSVRLGRSAPGRMTPSARGAFLNYDLLGERRDRRTNLNGLFELGVFSPRGSGTTTLLARSGGRGSGATRLESGWIIDDPVRLRSLRLGDAISRGGIGGTPFRFGGVQWGRSFDVQPGFVTMPLPSLGGEAALASVADIYVNNVLTARRDLQPGVFRVSDVPVVSGSGTVGVVVRDLLGRETSVSQSDYTAPELLRAGLDDYSIEAGFLRRRFGSRSFDYGSAVASGSYRRGLSDTFTAEVHAEATGRIQQAGAAAGFVLPGVALARLGVAASRSGAGAGMMVSAGIERSAQALSYGVAAEWATDDYVTPAASRWRPRRSLLAHVGLPLGFGSIGGSFAARSYSALPDLRVASVNATMRLIRHATLGMFASRSWGSAGTTTAQLRLLMPLGPRTTATGGVGTRGRGVSAIGSLQRDLPVGSGFGYRLVAETGEFRRLDGQVALQSDFGTFRAEAGATRWGSGARLSASGSIGTIGDHPFAARQLTQSFAAVWVGNFANVGVYADNQLIGRTGRDGVVVVPNLRTFDDNAIRIDSGDLPMTARLASDRRSIRPPRRAGVAVDFDVTGGRDAMLTVRLEDGSALPAGSRVRLEGSGEESVAAAGGLIYLSGLDDRNQVTVQLDNGTCSFEVALPPGGGAQPRLGPFTCRAPRA